MMKTLWLFLIGLLFLIQACGPRYYIAGNGQPGRIVVSAYTQDGCIEELEEEAKVQGVQVKLKDIESDLGWEILLWPFYKGYRCTGEVVGPATTTQ